MSKWALGILAAFLALMLAAYLLRGVVVMPWLEKAAAAALRSDLGLDLSVGHMHGSLLSDLELKGVRITSLAESDLSIDVAIPELRLRYRLADLLRGLDAFLGGLAIEAVGPEVRLDLSQASSAPARDAPPKPFAGMPSALPRLVLQGGRLDLTGDGFATSLENLAMVSLEDASDPLPRLAIAADNWRWHLPPLRDGEARAVLEVAMDPSGKVNIRDLTMDGVLVVTSGQVDLSALPAVGFSAHSPGPVGRLAVSGRVADDVLALAVNAGGLDLAHLERLLAIPALDLTGPVAGTVDLRLPLDRPEQLSGDVDLEVGPGRWRTLAWESATLRAGAADETLAVETAAIRRADGLLQLRELSMGTASLFAGAWEPLLAELNAVFDVSLEDLPAMAAALGASALPVEGDIPSHRLALQGRIQQGGLTVEQGRLTAAEGTLILERLQVDLKEILTQGAGAPFRAAAVLDWPDLGSLSTVLALPPLAGRLKGSVDLGGTWPNLRGNLGLSGENLAWGDVPLGRLELACRSDGRWLEMETARLRRGRDQVMLSGHVALDSGRLDDTRMDVQIADLAVYAKAFPADLPPLKGALQLDAALTGTVAAPQLAAAVTLAQFALGPLNAISAEGRLHTLPEGLRLERLVIRSPGGNLALAGRLDYPGEGKPLVLALAELAFERRGAALGLQAPVKIQQAGDGRWQIPPTVLTGSAGRITLEGELGGSAPADVAVELTGLDGGPWITPGEGPVRAFADLDARIRLTGDLSAPEVSIAGTLARLELRDWPQPLRGAFDLATGAEGIAIRRLRLQDNQTVRLTAAGRLPLAYDGQWQALSGPLQLNADLTIEKATFLNALAPELPVVDGAGEATIDVGGTLAEPRGTFRAAIRGLQLTTVPAEAAQGPFNARASGRLDPDGISLEVLRVESDLASLEGRGRWRQARPLTAWLTSPNGRSPGELTASADFSIPDLNWLAGLTPAIERTSGRLEGTLQVGGTLPEPSVTGHLALSEAGLQPRGDAPPLDEITAAIDADAAGMTIRSFRGEVGGAPFVITGELRRGEDRRWTVDLAMNGENLLLYRTADIRVRADTDLHLTGPVEKMALQGEVGLTNSRFRRNVDLFGFLKSAPPSAGTPSEVLFSLPDPPLKDMTFDVDIDSKAPVIVANNLVRGGLRPNLHLVGTGELPLLTGEIYLDPTRLRLPAGVMTIQSGVIRYLSSQANRPVMDLLGEGKVFDYDITALIEGPVDEPQVTLSSSPPLPGDELMLMLLTGRPPADRNSTETRGVPMNLAVYIGQDLLLQWFGGESTESWTSILDRFDVTVGRRVTRAGDETLEAQFRLGEDVIRDGDSIYITGERDVFDFYNAGVKFVFRFK